MIGYDDAIGEQVVGDAPIGGDYVRAWPFSDWDLFINGAICTQLLYGQLSGDATVGQRSTLRLTLRGTPDDPLIIPEIGALVQLVWRDALQVSAIVEDRRLRTHAERGAVVQSLQLECAGWERIAERRIVNETYADTLSNTILADLFTKYLKPEGVTLGVIDEGLALTLVKADYVRLQDALRDVAEASGGIYTITPHKQLEFRKVSLLAGRVVLSNAIAVGSIESSIERQDYRNVQIVTVKGTAGASTVVSRETAAEISARQAIEGGSGRYEHHISIQHPTSNDPTILERLGISAAIVNLRTYGRHALRLTGDTLAPGFRLGEIIEINMPAHGITGSWQVARLSFRTHGHLLRVGIEAVQTSALQRAFTSWLKIAQAAKAIVQIPGTPVFTNTVTYTSSTTFVVPNANGDGTPVEVEMDCYAGGGGGGGGVQFLDSSCSSAGGSNGGHGGKGGRATSWRTYAVGTVLTITVGGAGAGGLGGITSCGGLDGVGANGIAGGDSLVTVSGVQVARAIGGAFGAGSNSFGNGANGSDSNGVGDYTETGTGGVNGLGGIGGLDGTGGGAGRVVITY